MDKQLTAAELDELCAMQRRIAELYFATGLCSVDYSNIQLRDTEFLRIFSNFEYIRAADDYATMSAMLDGVKFIALTSSRAHIARAREVLHG